ncbi:efflux RND transporter periplasmic adaptor subunit [Halioglobus sp. Uisw_031]|uniref:efflux RND transporter periplasmic adaptor subunit n=1 Tax=Halioglobus sp. Uisw_031 TaxID=3230977 RepID=UPI0039EA4F4A
MVSRNKQVFFSIVMLAGSVVITTILYLNRPATIIEEPVRTIVTVDVTEVVKQNLRIPIQAQGTVTPLQETSVMSEVNGRIIEVSPSFIVGGFVSKDDVLLRIDPRNYETSLLRAEASVKSAQSNLAQETGRAKVAEQEWKKTPRGKQRTQASKDLYLRKPQLDQALAQMLAAQADLNTARDNLERTSISAPYDALIRTKHSELGQFVAAGTPLVDIFSVEYAQVRLPIPQNKLEYLELPELGTMQNGSPVDLYTEVGGQVKHWNAYLHHTEGVFDARSRVLFSVARIEDPYGLQYPHADPLRIGTFVNARIKGKELVDIVRLPRYIIRAGNNVWVIDETGLLRTRSVTLLRTGGDFVYVSAGLNDGELVSLTTLDNSFEGAQVRIESQIPSNMVDQAGRPEEQPESEIIEATAAAELLTNDSYGN